MKKKGLLLTSISLGLIFLLGIGVSYSMWNITVSQDNVNTATIKCFNVKITSGKNNITLENAYPIPNEKGKKLTPYSFTITNTCDIFASYQVYLESLKSTTLSSKFLDVMINNEEIKKLSEYELTDTVNLDSIESHILAKGSLGSGDSVSYTLRLWIDYDTTMGDLNNETKALNSKVVVISQPSNWNPVDKGYTTLHDAILANEYQTTPEEAIKKIEAKGSPDLTKTAPVSDDDFSDKGLYQADDDYGKTYYYRGNIQNNNVYFANLYWQIVRINGDGSIRLLYNGTEKSAKGINQSINNATYQYNNNSDSPIYSDYMYGNVDAKTFDDAHANNNSSTIKKTIDSWYENMLLKSNYAKFISYATGFCNDRSLSIGDGVGTEKLTHFGAFGRHYKKIATLKCPNIARDLFTTAISENEIRKIYGNMALTYPIGTITYDELIYAGMNITNSNVLSYAYSSLSYWTMSPAYYENNIKHTSNWFLYSGNDEWDKLHYNTVISSKGVRPVINLKPDVKISSGIGTINEPFIVKAE